MKNLYDRTKNILIDILIALLIVLAFTVVLKIAGYIKVEITSNSMKPTLKKGDIVLGKKVSDGNGVERGELIIFYSDEFESYLVKRVIGMPGDDVTIKNGIVFINGEAINEEYVLNVDDYEGSYLIPMGSYFVLGDNRLNSYDSRYFKTIFISEESIYGEIKMKLYPFNEIFEGV